MKYLNQIMNIFHEMKIKQDVGINIIIYYLIINFFSLFKSASLYIR